VAPSNQEKVGMMTLSITLARDLGAELPLFQFNLRTDQDLDNAIDDWLSCDRVDDVDHVYSWTDEQDEECVS
jgi:hypothetical protein